MKRYVLVRAEGAVYEIFSRAQLERELGRMHVMPCAIGVVNGTDRWFGPHYLRDAGPCWHERPVGVVYDFVCERLGYPPVRAISRARHRPTKRERTLVESAPMRALIRAARRTGVLH